MIAPELTRIARETIDRGRDRLRCREIELLTADLLDYEIPDDVTMAYFYDPLEGAAFERVIERLIASADRNPRRLRIVYLVPRESERLESTGCIRFVRNWRRGFLLWRPKDGARLYEIDPPGRSG